MTGQAILARPVPMERITRHGDTWRGHFRVAQGGAWYPVMRQDGSGPIAYGTARSAFLAARWTGAAWRLSREIPPYPAAEA